MTITPPDHSWIRPQLRWAIDPFVFACRVSVQDSSLIGILVAGSINVPVLPRTRAKATARLVPGIHSDCLERAAIDAIRDKRSQTERTFYLHEHTPSIRRGCDCASKRFPIYQRVVARIPS